MSLPCVHAPSVEAAVALLRERRRQLGISQAKVEERLGVAEGLVAKWETGIRRPGRFLLGCYAEVVGIALTIVEPAPAPERAAAARALA